MADESRPREVAGNTPIPMPEGAAQIAAAVEGTSYGVLEDGAGVLTVPVDGLFTAARLVKEQGFRILSVLSAYDRGDHYGILYAFVAPADRPPLAEARLRVVLPKKVADKAVEPTCPSLVDLFPAADWHEREMYDMYGIRFEGHPDLRRMFLPEGWDGYPMRKDEKKAEQYVTMENGEDVVVSKPQMGAW